MANEHFFSGADFSGLAGPFSGAFMAPVDAAVFGLPWAVDQPADSSAAAATAAHFDSAFSSLVSSPVTAAGDEDVAAIGDLIGRFGSICNSGVGSANTSCYSTPLSSPPHAAAAQPPPFHVAVARGYGAVLETGRLSRVSSSKSLGATPGAAGAVALENSGQVEAEMSSKLANPAMLAAGDGNARKRKASAKGGKAKDSSLAIKATAMAAAARNDASPKRSKLHGDKADDGSAAEENAEESNGNADAKTAAPEPHRDYIHVRARRGQATDSHSLAERVRRERISERMKMLQSLVPGCNKITGKALMLDEIINYVQSLQRQVEFLSMKLATLNPHCDSSNGHYLQCKDIHQTMISIYPDNSMTTVFSYIGHPTDPSTAAHHQIGGASWEQDLQSVVQMGIENNQEEVTAAAAALPLQNFYGQETVNHMKVEP